MSSNLLGRMMFAFRAGLQFAGRRNLYEVFGYPRGLTSPLLYAKYQRQDIVSRIVDMPPEEMWSLPPELPDDSPIKTKFDDLVKHSQLWDRIIQADKLCSFGQFSILMLGLRGPVNSPAPKLTNLSDLLYVQAYGGDSVRIGEWESDATNPKFGQPKMYQIQTGFGNMGNLNYGSSNSGSPATYIDVHASRCVHIVDRPVQGSIFAEPRLSKVYNILEDLLKIAGGSAELYWILGNRGMQVDVDKDMELDPTDATALTDELDEYQHGLRRYIRTRGVKINSLGTDSADPRGPFSVAMALLSATTNIPQRILMGAEAGQLASEQDRANFAEYIGRRRVVFAEPYMLAAILRKLEELTYIPKDSAKEATWSWEEAFHMNPVEESNALSAWARAVVNVSRRNQFGDPVISDEEARDQLGLPEKRKDGDTFPVAPPQKGAADGPQASPEGSKGTGVPVSEQPSTVASRTPGATA